MSHGDGDGFCGQWRKKALLFSVVGSVQFFNCQKCIWIYHMKLSCSLFCSVSCISEIHWRKRCANLWVEEATVSLSNPETYEGKEVLTDIAKSMDFIFEVNLTLKELCAKNLSHRICQCHCRDCKGSRHWNSNHPSPLESYSCSTEGVNTCWLYFFHLGKRKICFWKFRVWAQEWRYLNGEAGGNEHAFCSVFKLQCLKLFFAVVRVLAIYVDRINCQIHKFHIWKHLS